MVISHRKVDKWVLLASILGSVGAFGAEKYFEHRAASLTHLRAVEREALVHDWTRYHHLGHFIDQKLLSLKSKIPEGSDISSQIHEHYSQAISEFNDLYYNLTARDARFTIEGIEAERRISVYRYSARFFERGFNPSVRNPWLSSQ